MKTKRAILIAVVWAGLQGCHPKETKLDIPPGYREAQTATQEEIVELINGRYASLKTLTVSRFRVEFTGGSVERGYLKEYPSGKGYLAASRPDSIYLNILNPLTSSTVVAMATADGEFEIWVPRENKYLTGSTSVKLKESEPLYSVRPDHLLQAVMVEPVPVGDPRYRHFVEQEQDAARKYYVVDVVDLGEGSGRLCLSRKIWIERSALRLLRQTYYDCGAPLSFIEYGQPVELEGGQLLNRNVSLQRVREAYRLRLELEKDAMRADQPLKENAFHIPQPPGAELVVVQGDS